MEGPLSTQVRGQESPWSRAWWGQGAWPYHTDEVSSAILPRKALFAVVLADHRAQPAAEDDVGAV